MARSADVVLREQPDDAAPAVTFSLMGIWLDVDHVQGDWLKVGQGWVRESEVVRDEHVVDHFTARLVESENAFCLLGRARGWLKRADLDKAEADLNEALRLDPKNARAFFVLGQIAFDQKRPAEELADYERSLQLDPLETVSLAARGRARSVRGDYEGARQDFDTAIGLLPNDARLIMARGWCWSKKRDHDKGLADLNEAIRLNPPFAEALAFRSWVHYQRGEIDQAGTDADQALRLNPKLGRAFIMRGVVRAVRGDLDAGLSDLEEAVRLGPAGHQSAQCHSPKPSWHSRRNVDRSPQALSADRCSGRSVRNTRFDRLSLRRSAFAPERYRLAALGQARPACRTDRACRGELQEESARNGLSRHGLHVAGTAIPQAWAILQCY